MLLRCNDKRKLLFELFVSISRLPDQHGQTLHLNFYELTVHSVLAAKRQADDLVDDVGRMRGGGKSIHTVGGEGNSVQRREVASACACFVVCSNSLASDTARNFLSIGIIVNLNKA